MSKFHHLLRLRPPIGTAPVGHLWTSSGPPENHQWSMVQWMWYSFEIPKPATYSFHCASIYLWGWEIGKGGDRSRSQLQRGCQDTQSDAEAWLMSLLSFLLPSVHSSDQWSLYGITTRTNDRSDSCMKIYLNKFPCIIIGSLTTKTPCWLCRYILHSKLVGKHDSHYR